MKKSTFVLALVLLVLMISVFGASAATIITVDPNCIDTTPPDGNCDVANTYKTIQAGINAASTGDTINIVNATYPEVLTINTDGLTIVGASEAGVIIDATAATSYHLTVNASNTVLQNFTLNGNPAASYGIKASGLNTTTKRTNFTLKNATVNNTQRTGVDVNGIIGVVIDNVTVNNVPSGVGVALTDVDNATLSNITTSGNAWGGVAIYTWGRYYPGGSNNVVLSNINGSEADSLYVEVGCYPVAPATSCPPYAVTNLTLPVEYQYAVTNDEYRGAGSENFTHYQKTEGDAVAFGDGMNNPPPAAPSPPYVTNTASAVTRLSDGKLIVVPPLYIQAAVDAASAGNTVEVDAGTYVEQVLIDKDLTLGGVGSGTIIKAPATVPTCAVSSYDWHAIVCVTNDATVDISDLTVDGAGLGNSNYKFMGVAYRNAGGSVDNLTIKDIRDTPFSGAQHGVGLNLYNDDAATRSFSLTDTVFTGFQKNAMAFATGGTSTLNVDIIGNDITGAGATTVTAQNGVQIYEAAGTLTGNIKDNTVTGIAYDNTAASTKWVATSILNYYAHADITGNTVTEGHVGIYNFDASGLIEANDIAIEKIGVYAFGIIATDPPEAVPSPFGETSAADFSPNTLDSLSATAAVLNVDIVNNYVTFSGPDNTATYGIDAEAGWGPDDVAVNATGNSVSGFDIGFEFYICESSCDTGVFTGITATGNRMYDNNTGMRSNVSYLTVDGEDNWWGEPSGPYHATSNPLGTGDAVSDGVDYDPWDPIAPIYDSVPTNYIGSYPSQPFQAQQTNEFGDHVAFARNERLLDKVVVSMNDWACENDWIWNSGTSSWDPGRDKNTTPCITTPGTGFNHDITLTLYEVDNSGSDPALGTAIISKTESKYILFRPSADTVNCTGDRWLDPLTNKCNSGYAFDIEFDFSADEELLPNEVIFGIAYNTQTYGSTPIGSPGPYNSLNVNVALVPPEIGTDVEDDTTFWNTETAGWYCDGGAGGTDTFRRDAGCWAPYVPAVEFYATSGSVTTNPADELVVCNTPGQVIVGLTDVANLWGYEIGVDFDETVVSGSGAYIDSFFDTATGIPYPIDCSSVPGTCTFTAVQLGGVGGGSAVSGSGPLFSIDLAPIAGSGGVFDLEFSLVELSDVDGFLISNTLPDPLVEVSVCGQVDVDGVVDLQGRAAPGDATGTVKLVDPVNFGTYTTNFLADGSYSFTGVDVLPGGSDYRFEAAHDLYISNEDDPVNITPGTYTAATTRLLGGDANLLPVTGGVKPQLVNLLDITCIANSFGTVNGCPTTGSVGSTDINADLNTNIQDLSIAGGNYEKWSFLPW